MDFIVSMEYDGGATAAIIYYYIIIQLYMVLSRINKLIQYNESREIEPRDLGHVSPIYEVRFPRQDLTIAVVLGKAKIVTDGPIVFPIYLIGRDDIVQCKIGVLEYPYDTTQLIKYAAGDLTAEEFGEPLLFGFATAEFLSAAKSLEYNHDSPADAPAEPAPKKKIQIEEPTAAAAPAAPAAPTSDYFINKVLKMPPARAQFVEEPVAGDGDCFYTSLQNALSNTDTPATVLQLRAIVADNITEEYFRSMKEPFNDLMREKERLAAESARIEKELKKFKKGATAADFARNKDLMDQKEKLAAEIATNSELLGQYKHIAGISSLSSLKSLIKQPMRYWADAAAIKILENEFKLRVVAFDSGRDSTAAAAEQVVLCNLAGGDVPADVRYVFMDFSGNHYNLVLYDGRRIHSAAEIPPELATILRRKKCIS